MNKQYDIALIGGDMRQLYMADYLQKSGYRVVAVGLPTMGSHNSFIKAGFMKEAMEQSTYIVVPIPMSKGSNCISVMDGETRLSIEAFCGYLQPNHYLFGGIITSETKKYCEDNNIPYLDFMENSEIAVRNAVATAEGAIAEAILHSEGNLHQSNGLVLGYGRCAKVLARKLQALGMNVTIGARKESDRTEAFSLGYQSMKLIHLKQRIEEFEYIFNTIPTVILSREILSVLSLDTTIIDIASVPGGLDYQAVKDMHLNAHLCLGIPGKIAPKASAEILVEAIISIMKERSE